MPLPLQPTAFNYQPAERGADVKVFRSVGTWVKPPNALFVRVCVWGGGGGGGAGTKSNASSIYGAGAGTTVQIYDAAARMCFASSFLFLCANSFS